MSYSVITANPCLEMEGHQMPFLPPPVSCVIFMKNWLKRVYSASQVSSWISTTERVRKHKKVCKIHYWLMKAMTFVIKVVIYVGLSVYMPWLLSTSVYPNVGLCIIRSHPEVLILIGVKLKIPKVIYHVSGISSITSQTFIPTRTCDIYSSSK